MKRLIMCEGPNELAVIRILLEYDALIFGEDDLLGLTPYHARQISKSPQVQGSFTVMGRSLAMLLQKVPTALL